MKYINKILIASFLLTGSIGTMVLIKEGSNNQFENNPIEQSIKDVDFDKISSHRNQNTHGNVNFVSVSVVEGKPTSDVTVITNGYIDATNPNNSLNDNIALAIYEDKTITNKKSYLGYVETSITEIKSYSDMHTWTIPLAPGKSFVDGTEYKIKGARQKFDHSEYDILLNTKVQFKYIEAPPAKINSITTTPTQSNYPENDGSIEIETIIDYSLSLDDVEVTLDSTDETKWVAPNSTTLKAVTHTFENLAPGFYNINVRTKTDPTADWIVGESVKVEVAMAPVIDIPTITTPKANDDGSVTYHLTNISITLKLREGTINDDDINVNSAKFEIVDKDGEFLSPKVFAAVAYANGTFTLAPGATLVVPADQVKAGYSIVLTGVNYKGTIIDDISIIPEKGEGLSDGIIAAIIFGTILGIGLLFFAGYTLFQKTDTTTK